MLAMSACVWPNPTTTNVPQFGILSGKVTISPLCPVEPCTPGVNPFSTRDLLLHPSSGETIYVGLNDNGEFSVSVPEGEYLVELTDCDYLGCLMALPVETTVLPNETTALNIDIDTGIRGPAFQEPVPSDGTPAPE